MLHARFVDADDVNGVRATVASASVSPFIPTAASVPPESSHTPATAASAATITDTEIRSLKNNAMIAATSSGYRKWIVVATPLGIYR